MGSLGSVPPDDVQDIPKPWIETPLVESAALSRAAGCRIFLKLENLQPSASFKSRAIGNLIRSTVQSSPPGTPLHFYTSSGGNAGLACVHAARSLGYPASVVVPLSTKAAMVAKLKREGAAAVVQLGASWAEADAYLREVELPGNPHAVYVHPFDHDLVRQGSSLIVDEIQVQLDAVSQSESKFTPSSGRASSEPPAAIVCSVGGGGLLAGTLLGIERNYGAPGTPGHVPVLALETRGADSLAHSLAADEPVTLPAITSIATSLGARRVAAATFALARAHAVRSVVLDDAEAAMACWRFADDERMLVEAACGVALAVCYDGRLRTLLPQLKSESRVVIVVCGGSNVSLDVLEGYKKTYGEAGEAAATQDTGVPSTHSAPKHTSQEAAA